MLAYRTTCEEKHLRILVTGGAGFIGSNFIRRTILKRPSTQIFVLDSLTYAGSMSNLDGLEKKISFVHGDVRDSILLDTLVPSVDLVVHFAAESHNDNSLADARPFLETNVMGTFELIQSCVKHSIRLHHVSTDEVFGDLPIGGTQRFKPETPYNPSSPYSASKAASDMLVRAWVRSFGLKATISNCSNNYGLNQNEEKFIPKTILLAAHGLRPRIYGDGSNIRDWIHVDDHTDGIWAIIDRGQNGQTYLLGTNGERSNLQVAQAILGIMGIEDSYIEFVPDRPGHDVRYAIDASRTISELDWKPNFTKFEKGLVKIVQGYTAAFGLESFGVLDPD